MPGSMRKYADSCTFTFYMTANQESERTELFLAFGIRIQKRSCLILLNVPKIVGGGSDLADRATERRSLLKHQQTHASLDSPGRNYDRAEQKAQSPEKGPSWPEAKFALGPEVTAVALKQIFHSQKPIPLAEMHKRANSGDTPPHPHPPTPPSPLPAASKKENLHTFVRRSDS